MKSNSFDLSLKTVAEIAGIWQEWRGKKLPLSFFLALCFNLILAPVVFAATDGTLSRSQAWALGLLGLGTIALAIYLLFVMFVPEKF